MNESRSVPAPKDSTAVAYYDGDCALCRSFVASASLDNKKQPNAEGATGVQFINLRSTELPDTISAADARREIHFRDEHGTILRNVDAVAEIWRRNRKHAILRAVIGLPIAHAVAVACYRIVAAYRFSFNTKK